MGRELVLNLANVDCHTCMVADLDNSRSASDDDTCQQTYQLMCPFMELLKIAEQEHPDCHRHTAYIIRLMAPAVGTQLN